MEPALIQVVICQHLQAFASQSPGLGGGGMGGTLVVWSVVTDKGCKLYRGQVSCRTVYTRAGLEPKFRDSKAYAYAIPWPEFLGRENSTAGQEHCGTGNPEGKW